MNDTINIGSDNMFRTPNFQTGTLNVQGNMSAKDKQVGGKHYKQYDIQPIEFYIKNNIPFAEGSVIKYVLRHREKGGVVDIEKAIHYLELIKEMEYGEGAI